MKKESATVDLKKETKAAGKETAQRAASTPASLGELRKVKRSDLMPSPSNPRKSFPEGTLKELAESIGSQGVQHALLVRAWPTHCPMKHAGWDVKNHAAGKGKLEIVDGERRYRAGALAKVEEYPVIVRELTDEQVYEIQLISFLQREGVSALEEGESYRELIDAKIHTVETLMAKLGKSRAHVYGRLALCKASPVVKKAMESGTIDATMGGLIAGIPNTQAQTKALKEIQDQEMSFRQAKQHIEEDYQVNLKDAQWDLKDATLVPAAGACEGCPKRAASKCLDTVCFAEKKEAMWKRMEAAARTNGQKVLTPQEYEKIRHSSAYVKLQDDCYRLQGSNKPWRELVKGQDLKPMLARDRYDGLVEIVPKEQAEAAAKKNKHKFYSSSGGDGAWEAKRRKEQAENRKKRNLMKVVREQAVVQLVRHGIVGSGVEFWRLLTQLALQMLPFDDTEVLAARRNPDKSGKNVKFDADKLVEGLALAAKSEAELKGLLLEALALHGWMEFYKADFGDNFELACKHFKIDLKKMMEQAAKPKQPELPGAKFEQAIAKNQTKVKGKKKK